MKRKLIPLLMFCLSFVLPSFIFGNDIPTFPPTLPFSYNGVTYTNALAQSGNMSACGSFLNIKEIWYYNKKPTFKIYGIVNSVYGTPPTAVTTIGVDHTSQAVRFLSRTQNSTDNYVATEYPNGVSFGIGWQCYRYRMDPNSVYTNNDVYQYNSTTLFKGANVFLQGTLSIFIAPDNVGSVTGSGIDCGLGTTDVCQKIFTEQEEITITANPSSGYAFSHWQEGEELITDNPYLLNINSNKELVSVFEPAFLFPLQKEVENSPGTFYTPYTILVYSVMDQNTLGTVSSYVKNGSVQAFNGETGSVGNGCWCYSTNSICTSSNYTDCSVVGFKNTNHTNFLDDVINYNDDYLYYDGHPGYDYPQPRYTDIYSPAGGTLCVATPTTQKPTPDNVWRDETRCPLATAGTTSWDGYHTFYVIHNGLNINDSVDDYMTVFLHNDSLETSVMNEIEANGYAEVIRGQHIAEVGDVGASGAYHVHLEVYKRNGAVWERVDPYGNGTTNILWRE